MKQNSYAYWFNRNLAKIGTFYCQRCGQLMKGQGVSMSKALDNGVISLKFCEMCAGLSALTFAT